jgi:hypothetical protein
MSNGAVLFPPAVPGPLTCVLLKCICVCVLMSCEVVAALLPLAAPFTRLLDPGCAHSQKPGNLAEVFSQATSFSFFYARGACGTKLSQHQC